MFTRVAWRPAVLGTGVSWIICLCEETDKSSLLLCVYNTAVYTLAVAGCTTQNKPVFTPPTTASKHVHLYSKIICPPKYHAISENTISRPHVIKDGGVRCIGQPYPHGTVGSPQAEAIHFIKKAPN